MGVNSVFLAGYAGSDPKIFRKDNFMTARLSVSTTTHRNKRVMRDWHSVEFFGGVAEFVEKYVKKGDYVIITGFNSSTTYTDKNGKTVQSYGVKALTIVKAKMSEEPLEKPEADMPIKQEETSVDEHNDDVPY
jgi:single-strand DNA-binding protein